ncbi:MAG: hypothetical protein AB7O43_01650 [Hyphomicrobiaceae bacterium]
MTANQASISPVLIIDRSPEILASANSAASLRAYLERRSRLREPAASEHVTWRNACATNAITGLEPGTICSARSQERGAIAWALNKTTNTMQPADAGRMGAETVTQSDYRKEVLRDA